MSELVRQHQCLGRWFPTHREVHMPLPPSQSTLAHRQALPDAALCQNKGYLFFSDWEGGRDWKAHMGAGMEMANSAEDTGAATPAASCVLRDSRLSASLKREVL